MGDHLLGGDPNGFRDVVWDVEIGWPNRSDTLGHGCASGVGLDSMPEEGGYETNYDGEAAEVPSERGAHGNGEGYVKAGADDTIEDEGDSAYYAAEYDAIDGFSPEWC
jgi:hypothetical protein